MKRSSFRTFLLEAIAVVALIAVAEFVTQWAKREYAPPLAPTAPATAVALATRTPTPAATSTPEPTFTLRSSPSPTHSPEPTALPPTLTPYPTAFAQDGLVLRGDTVLLDVSQVAPSCRRVGEVSYSPTGEHILVILACQGWENVAFLFEAEAEQGQPVTGPWDLMNAFNYRWSADGESFVYQRINACCRPPSEIPSSAPVPGLVRYDVRSGEKRLLSRYRVAHVQRDDHLNVRSAPGVENPIVGTFPPDAQDILIIGAPAAVGDSRWVPVRRGELEGWVNFRYLERQTVP